MTDALRLELRKDGIPVSLIVPGTIQSDIWRKEREGMAAMGADSRVRQLYGSLIDTVAANVFRHADHALPAERVADLVERCLTSPNPRVQYRVGWEAQVGARAKRLMPDRLFDFLLRRSLGVPRTRGTRSLREPPPTGAGSGVAAL
jgi:short-subunit dehydrogenase